ncbi:hypothetical protein PTTG_00169 [Puccinia triticina 1-1 BBBD Race 1]|uniref:Adhesin domain-containing protein n=2 Tax=Puccinia triticina TaxID=208348 RepID=A0A180GYW3_PUCT1|nr:uncharacterized protein PtA15_9A619 [Puccinia triticina]OAV97442.1 hypothetical protein PTTG_00169 [Puccinia triticina 1-1 BBBD Race 1]WAQ88492.1 hypothetical protein PtA15_9A619 [Puccinia triticina]
MSDNPQPTQEDIDRKKPAENEPLLPQASTSASTADRPRTVRHHRRALSGRSTRSGLSGQISFGPSYNPNIYPSVNDPFTRQAKQAADGRARSRFLKALLVGIGLWIVVGLVFGWAGLHRAGWSQGNNRADYGAKPSVPRSDGRAIWCAKFDTPQAIMGKSRMPGETLRSKATLSIPLGDRDSFFIHGQGSFAKGRISIGTTDSQDIQIQLAALTNDEALIDLMTVCHVSASPAQNQLSGGGRNVGLGIYTPAPEVGPYPDSDLEFNIQVNLPKNVALMDKLSVQADQFGLTTADLAGLSIAQVDITTAVAPIRIEALVSETITIRTNNGHIEGAFKISKALNLATTNGAIVANVALALPINKSSDALLHTPSEISNRTFSFGSNDQPSVSVDIATINGAVAVNYVEHPADMKLFSYVKSTNGRAHVEHAPAYEGEFEVETTWGSADVKGPLTKDDPSGLTRARQKLIKSNRDELGFRHISGLVWWGEDDQKTREEKANLGHSLVKTTLGSARAIFQ